MHKTSSAAIFVSLTIAAMATVATRAQQQPTAPSAPSGMIMGRVVDTTTDSPLAGVLLELAVEPMSGAAPSGTPRRQLTNAQGRFLFRGLPAGRVTVRATVGGNTPSPSGFLRTGSGFPIGAYLAGGFGQLRPGGSLKPITLADGQTVSDAEIRLWPSGSISGTITDDLGEPLADVMVGAVRLSADGTLLNGPVLRTDDRGMYRLSGLAPGKYIVFVPQTQRVTPMEVVESAEKSLLDRAAKTGSAVASVATLSGVRVGSAVIATEDTGGTANMLPPRVENGAAFVIPTTFFPGGTTFNPSTAIDVSAGRDRAASDIVVRTVPTATVSGTVTAAGAPGRVGVVLVPAGSRDAAMFEVAQTSSDANGRFTFPAVPLGGYTLMVMSGPTLPGASPTGLAGGPGAWATVPFTVESGGVPNLQVPLRPGFSLRGRVEFDGTAAKPDETALKNLRINITRARPLSRGFTVPGVALLDPSSQFSLIGLSPARYMVRPSLTTIGAWRLKSIVIGGRDIADLPVDVAEDTNDVVVTFTDQPTTLAISVTGADADDTTVVLFPADRSTWTDLPDTSARLRVVRMPTERSVVLPTMLPGDYLAVAVADDVLVDFPRESLLTKLASVATSVRVSPGQRTAVALVLKKVQQ